MKYVKLKNSYIRTDFRELRIYTSSIHHNGLRDFTLITLTVARFLGTMGFLIRYSNGRSKDILPINAVPRLVLTRQSFNLENQ